MRARLILAIAVLSALAAPVPALAVKEVGYQALLAQVRSGPLQRAVINRRGQDIEIKFTNNDEWKAPYPRGAQPLLQRILRERHVHVIFATPRRAPIHKGPVHHHLRYIAAGVLGAALAIGGVLLAYRRRRGSALARGGA